MPLAALDDRTFESVVPMTPEQQAEHAAHFREKGYEITVEDPGDEDNQPDPADAETAAAPAQETSAVEPAATPVADPVPATTTASVPHGEADDETIAEWNADADNEKRLGRAARKTKRIKELEAKLAETNGQLSEARRQLTGRQDTSTAMSEPVNRLEQATASPTVSEPATSQPAKIPEPKQFDKPRPTRPKFEDFASSDDPISAHADAVAEWTEKDADWRDEKREFERDQREQAKEAQRRQQAEQDRLNEQKRTIDSRFAAARQAHPDFDSVTNSVVFSPVMRHLLTEKLPDGLELAYQLSLPENRELKDRLLSETGTQKGEADASVISKLEHGLSELAVFRHILKTKSALPPAVDAPPPAGPAVPQPETRVSPQSPSTAVQPRREEASPTPVRGRGAPGDRIEDIDPEDSDARREWKRRHGQLR